MFCSKCGTKNEDSAQFCSSCGVPIEKISQIQPQVETQMPPQPQIQPQQPQFQQSYQPQHNFQPQPPTPNKNINKFIGIGAVAVVGLVLIILIAGLFNGYSNSTPEKATLSFYKAVSKQNIDEVMNLMDEEVLDEMLELGYMDKKAFEEMLEDSLKSVDEEGEDELGKNWHKKIKVTNVDEEDGFAEVTIEMDGNEETMYLYESKGKWYINFYDMF